MLQIEIFEHYALVRSDIFPDNWRGKLEECKERANEKLVELGKLDGAGAGCTHLIELNLMLNDKILEINRDLRNVDKITDVISLKLAGEERFENEPYGEIYISIEKCKEQAREVGNTFFEEFLFLFIHGILHIFGYDHQTPEEEEEMMGIAYEILGRK